MEIHSPSQQILVKNSVVGAITAGAINGTGVDCLGAKHAFAVVEANPSGAGTTSTWKLQESSDNVTFADVPSGAFPNVVVTSGAGAGQVNGPAVQVMDVDLGKRLRYLRLVQTGAGGAAAGQVNGEILLFNEIYKPVTQDNTTAAV